jgi:hypothetical protein
MTKLVYDMTQEVSVCVQGEDIGLFISTNFLSASHSLLFFSLILRSHSLNKIYN